ncbi:hypothetical protein H5P28_17280 [Ruficoccus amylovorans]|uniref:Sensory rhodopsin transducer n=1 Tax=Ruficoccus amylovorans TaxID=1804625 RepID=A0A842HHY7_9BACT|nr:sensory rhodopsin transducer [Ruficoccus amylovorans]MBC2596022.1 hypothetical protein [Ruficoccus amylovorans]
MSNTSTSSAGKTRWYIADAYLPSCGRGETWEGHESVCVLNVGAADATLDFILYFDGREPIEIKGLKLPARSNRHIGMHKPEMLGGVEVPRDVPYGIEVASDQPVIVQYSRLDVTQPNFTLMTTIPYAE